MSLYWNNMGFSMASDPAQVAASAADTFGMWFVLVALPYSFVPSITAFFGKIMNRAIRDPYESMDFYEHSSKSRQLKFE